MTIQELREKRSKAWDTARDFLDSKRNESGLLSEEDSKTYDAMEQQIVAYGKEIQRLERQAQIEAEMNKPTSTPIQNKPNASTHSDTKTGIASDEYCTAFWNSIRSRNFYDIRNDLQVGTDTEGGYLVPSEFERKLVEALTEENIFRQLATVIKTSSGDRKIPIVTSKGEAAWMDEEDAYKLSDDTFGQASLGAYKVGTAIKISEELLNDAAFDLPSYIAKEFARRIGAKEEEAFFIGDGKGKPTGIFAATGGAESGATTSTANITFDDVLELFYSLRSPYRKKAVWVLNDSTVKALRKLKDSTGNYIWNPSVQAGVPDTILNRPYYTSSYVPEIKALLGEMLLLGVLIISFMGGLLIMWIYRSLLRPLHKLQEATKQIRDGNLDFTLDVDDEDEIGMLCQDFEEMRLRLKESQEEKLQYDKESKELISNISHDLKTPITAIKGYVEGIQDGVASSPEKLNKYIRTIYNKANDMDRLIDELTFYSKIDTNKIPYNFSKINVAEYFGDCVEEVGLDMETRGIELGYFNYVDEDVVVIADAEQMKRVINNIIGNSLKYLDKKKGILNIRIKDDGDFIQVIIEDNGKGIAAKDLPYIFDRFYRTDSSRNSSKGGSGIGLSIVKKIIEDHGGRIWATSKEGIGTEIHFVLRKYVGA